MDVLTPPATKTEEEADDTPPYYLLSECVCGARTHTHTYIVVSTALTKHSF